MSALTRRAAVAAATAGIAATLLHAGTPGVDPEEQFQERQREAAQSIRRTDEERRRDGAALGEAVRKDGLRSREVREREAAARAARALLRARLRGR